MEPRKILVADDSRNIIELLKYNFEKKGYGVIEAYDGEQTINKALSEKPDIIILDINMPLKDGFEVCRVLRNTPQTLNIPIIILSGRSKEFDRLTGFSFGADDYVVKPFKVEELIERADSLLVGPLAGRAGRKVMRSSNVPGEIVKAGERASYVSLGDEKFDSLFKGKLYRGANVLLAGSVGTGKSTICRKFMAAGLKQEESGLYVAAEDPPALIIESLNSMLAYMIQRYEDENRFRIVSIPGMKAGDYDEMLKTITDAGEEIDQSIRKKKGGRRIIDSISGLISHYGETRIYQFLSQIVHTAAAFGGVTTLYTLEEGTITAQQSATVRSLMDGVIELKEESAGIYAKVVNMKWVDFSSDKIKLWNKI